MYDPTDCMRRLIHVVERFSQVGEEEHLADVHDVRFHTVRMEYWRRLKCCRDAVGRIADANTGSASTFSSSILSKSACKSHSTCKQDRNRGAP